MALESTLAAMMAADLDSVKADSPSVLVIGGQTVNGTASPATNGDSIDGDGLRQTTDMEFVGKLTDFSALPSVRSVGVLDGVAHSVAGVVSDGACVHLTLERSRDRTATGGIL